MWPIWDSFLVSARRRGAPGRRTRRLRVRGLGRRSAPPNASRELCSGQLKRGRHDRRQQVRAQLQQQVRRAEVVGQRGAGRLPVDDDPPVGVVCWFVEQVVFDREQVGPQVREGLGEGGVEVLRRVLGDEGRGGQAVREGAARRKVG